MWQVYFQRRDPGENIDKKCWQPDTEPAASEVDSWVSGVIPVVSASLQDQVQHQSVIYPPDIVQVIKTLLYLSTCIISLKTIQSLVCLLRCFMISQFFQMSEVMTPNI